ncbi:cation diffusion facilitator family transporter [Paracoccus aestuariivivens]|uniref:Cation transporter n=1 Tax=Paracoccus aestuariivivens TaxID=1820333 RepID=A0A6L6J7I3_9RHOB|nr:cation transporter [Paracoccus aestuariivivens]MTH76689.1 cation transporter [Paracoccus aestuariivivens]
MSSEQQVLRRSIIVTFIIAAIGVGFGLMTGSYSIVFDGIYSLTDASMTVLSLWVTRLIAAGSVGQHSKLTERFNMGFWHLEPIVLGLNGAMLIGASIYGLINAIGSLLTGGRHLEFGWAIVYAAITIVAGCFMASYGRRANRRIRSSFLALDVKAWIMSVSLTGALLVAFVFGWAIQGTNLEWMSPYVDPAVLALISVVVIPIPLSTVRQALADILLVTPPVLRQHVDEVAERQVGKYGFLGHRAYVARVGRGRQIEIYFIVPTGAPARPLEEWDRIRDEIGEEIGGEGPDRWLTIAFTTDREWAE